MLFFTHILNFKRALLLRLKNKRRQERHRVGSVFPLKASITLADGAGSAGGGPGCEWSGRVIDVSSNGLSMVLPLAAATTRHETTTVRVLLEGRELSIPSLVAHFGAHQAHAICGLRLKFDDVAGQRAWQQIVEAVSIGASFAPVGARRVPRVSQGLYRFEWKSLKRTRLIEWREAATRKLTRFELAVADHRIEGRVAERTFEIQPRSQPGRAVSPEVEADVRRLFLWVTANLPASAPVDLRDFMIRSVAPREPTAAGARNRTATGAPAKPPSELTAPLRATRSPA